jgi:hypothetical protein
MKYLKAISENSRNSCQQGVNRKMPDPEIENINLEQPANVLWWNAPPPANSGAIFGAETRHFESISNAVRFIMDDLTDFAQSTAWIQTHEGAIQGEQLRELCSKLKRAP